MDSISHYLAHQHAGCDDRFAAAEDAAAEGDWDRCSVEFDAFSQALEAHFRAEEEVLFPALERASGAPAGPTAVMRHEHGQMRALVRDLADAIAQRDAQDYLGRSEVLLILMQQHNLKEERILYPMADQSLAGRREALLAQLARVTRRWEVSA